MKKFIPLIAFLLLNCNELPIGEEQFDLRGDFIAQEIELQLLNTLTEFDLYPNLGLSHNLIVGKNDSYEARILLEFDFPDTSYQGLDEIKLILRTNTDFHNDTIRVSIHLLTNEFDQAEANWYKRNNNDWWDSAGGDFESDSIRLVETKGDSLIITFNYIELEEIMDAEGLIIIPVDSGFCYFRSQQALDEPGFLLVKNDVVTSIQLIGDCHILTGFEPFYTESWIGSGIPFYNYAKFIFDSTLIDKKAVYAQLTFRPEHHFIMRDSFQIVVRQLLEPLVDFDTEASGLIGGEWFSVDDTIFEIDIVQHIQHIIEHPDSNFGVFILLYKEDYDIANFKMINGSHALKVGYLDPPQGRF